MILYQYLVIHVSFIIFVVVKIICKIAEKYRLLMHDKKSKLTSIPEGNETEDEIVKWVPKKKHEILKAKYKCLKKLFQIYDASVIGMLPETVIQEPELDETIHRRRRSYRTKTDACAGTSDCSSGDVTQSENDTKIATVVLNELKLDVPNSDEEKSKLEKTHDKHTQDSKENIPIVTDKCVNIETSNTQQMYVINKKRKPTRFQSFIQRLLGIHRDTYECVQMESKTYAASDNNISNKYEKRRRRGLRFRRIRRLKKVHSEIVLRDAKSPVILSYVQSVQRSCLQDTTPRQCPIAGCNMIFYGIINYNDHLNMYHFPEKKYICHYCHEGFSREHLKVVHENGHIGITKLAPDQPPSPLTSALMKITNDTQTEVNPKSQIDVPEDKLKKIVSFFDKIQDPDQIVAEVKNKRFSELNLQKDHVQTDEFGHSDASKSSDKSTSSCMDVQQKFRHKLRPLGINTPPRDSCVICEKCGEHFSCRRQLSLHADLEHRVYDKFSKFHSCVGMINQSQETEDKASSLPLCTESELSTCSGKDLGDLRHDPSTNIVYYTSTETLDKKPSSVNSFVQKVRTGFCYKWEPGTKIIRV